MLAVAYARVRACHLCLHQRTHEYERNIFPPISTRTRTSEFLLPPSAHARVRAQYECSDYAHARVRAQDCCLRMRTHAYERTTFIYTCARTRESARFVPNPALTRVRAIVAHTLRCTHAYERLWLTHCAARTRTSDCSSQIALHARVRAIVAYTLRCTHAYERYEFVAESPFCSGATRVQHTYERH